MVELVIPRIIHRVWLGPNEIPSIFTHYEQSLRKHHPQWELRTWRDDSVSSLNCMVDADEAEGFGKLRYDTVRLEILRQFGGVIVDMDIEAIRPLDPLLKGVTAFAGRMGRAHVGNQVLGAIPHHPFFEKAVARLGETPGTHVTSSKIAGKAFLGRLVKECPNDVTVFPQETFYFEPSFAPPRSPDVFPHVYTVHHELATYAVPLSVETINRRLVKFVREVARVQVETMNMQRDASVGSDGELRLISAQARRVKAERRLRRAIVANESAYKAQVRRAEAEREQAEARLRDLLSEASKTALR